MQTINRKIEPKGQSIENWNLKEPDIYYLSNGIKVVEFDAGTQELVRIELIFRAGSWFQANNFVALATNMMLREGSKHNSSARISDQLDFYGAHLETTAEKDNAYVSLYTLNKHLQNTLPLLMEIVKEAAFPEQEFLTFSGKQRQMLEVNLQKVNYIARTRFNSLLFGKSHPYGNYMITEDIDKIQVSHLRDFHSSHYHASNCIIMVAGKIDPELKNSLERSFGGGSWVKGEYHEIIHEVKTAEKRTHFHPKPDAVQSAIRMGLPLFNRSHPDYQGIMVLNTLLGGYFGSRLMNNLREDKGYTYGIGSAAIPLKHGGYFFISCEVGSDVTVDAIAQIRLELLRLAEERAGEKELTLVRNYLLGSFLRGIDGPFAMADVYRDVMEHGLDSSFHYSMLETIQGISSESLRTLAEKYLNPDQMFRLVVGNPELEASLSI